MSSINEIKQFYDEATYRKLHGFIYSNPRVEYAWRGLKTVFDFITPKSVLELGSGIGEISFRLASEYPAAVFYGFDISEQSVKIASNLFVLPNLSYVRADDINDAQFESVNKFDVIFLMDVYEHISIDSRERLHHFIKNNISHNGFVFLSCPTPQHLDYLRINIPTEIQPVDENISFKELMDLSYQTDLKLIKYNEVSVWNAGDYFHAIFSNHLKMQRFSDFKIQKETITTIGLKKEILKKLKLANNLIDDPNLQSKKKQLIQKMLGQEILDKVEDFGKKI